MEPCPFCGNEFTLGDRGTVIGRISRRRRASRQWVHIRCLLGEVGGEVAVAAYDRQWADEARPGACARNEWCTLDAGHLGPCIDEDADDGSAEWVRPRPPRDPQGS